MQSLQETSESGRRASILVVDDSDEGLDLDVPKLRLGGGSGFARAANAGLAAIRTPGAVLLNDDALPADDCLDRLARRPAITIAQFTFQFYQEEP